jgi:hypothetical protein
LESIVCAGRRYTSVEAIERFVAATTAAANGERPPIRTPRQRQRAIEAAEREMGITPRTTQTCGTEAFTPEPNERARR